MFCGELVQATHCFGYEQGFYSEGYTLKNPEGASVDGRYKVNYLVVYSVV